MEIRFRFTGNNSDYLKKDILKTLDVLVKGNGWKNIKKEYTYNILNEYYSDNPIEGEWKPHDKNPIIIDPDCARMGGIIIESGKIFRIAQSQEFNIYGYGSKIFEIINLSTNTYEEKLIHNIIYIILIKN